MKKTTPVEAYRLLSSPSNKPIVFLSSRGTPCISQLSKRYEVNFCPKIGVKQKNYGGRTTA